MLLCGLHCNILIITQSKSLVHSAHPLSGMKVATVIEAVRYMLTLNVKLEDVTL